MDLQLLAALLLGIAAVVVIVLRTRLDAFIGLLVAGLLTGFVAGAPPPKVLESITVGFGETLGTIGIVIGLGVAVGKILEVSGAADALAGAFTRAFGAGREPWAMASTGFIVSIPVFCDSAYVIMNPLARSIARRRRAGYVTLALALGCGMTLTHHLVPPTPGPLAATGLLDADIGMVILFGLIMAAILLPVVVLYAKWIGPKLESALLPEVHEAVYADDSEQHESAAHTSDALGTPPSGAKPHRVNALLASLPLLVPLLLIIVNTVATAIDQSNQGMLGDEENYEPSTWAGILAFIGDPSVALIIGLVLAVYLLLPRWITRTKVSGWLAEAAASAGLILLITGAGGAFGQVLRDTGIGDELATLISSWSLPAVLVPFLIASFVRIAQGSGTVAIITSASVSAPIVSSMGLSPTIAVLACCAGSMVFSYFNDSYFWVVTRFTGLDGTAALRGWSGITTAVWLGSLPLLLIGGAVL